MASNRRILEMALKGLEAERDVILSEIAELRARLGGRVAKVRRRRAGRALRNEVSAAAKSVTQAVKKRGGKRRKLTANQRKAISERMKATWARRRAQSE